MIYQLACFRWFTLLRRGGKDLLDYVRGRLNSDGEPEFERDANGRSLEQQRKFYGFKRSFNAILSLVCDQRMLQYDAYVVRSARFRPNN